MSRIRTNILITDINDNTEKVTEKIISWPVSCMQLQNTKTHVNLNYTQLYNDVNLRVETDHPCHLFVPGLKGYTILVMHQHQDISSKFQHFQPICFLNEDDHYETNFDKNSNLSFYFFKNKKRKLQIFYKINYSEIFAYSNEIVQQLYIDIEDTLSEFLFKTDVNWFEQQKVLQDKLYTSLHKLLDSNLKNIRKNEIKRRVSRLAVLKLIYAYPKKNIYLEKLSKIARVSARSLQTNFLNSYNISPTHFHKKVRLTAVNDLLYQEDPRQLKVTHAAIDHGFTHLGQFSCDYKKFFTESPSTTLFSG